MTNRYNLSLAELRQKKESHKPNLGKEWRILRSRKSLQFLGAVPRTRKTQKKKKKLNVNSFPAKGIRYGGGQKTDEIIIGKRIEIMEGKKKAKGVLLDDDGDEVGSVSRGKWRWRWNWK